MPREFPLCVPLLLAALAGCQSAPPVEEEVPPAPEPVEYAPAGEQLEQVFDDGGAGSRHVVLPDYEERPVAGISPETIELANEIRQEPRSARPRRVASRSPQSSAPPASVPAPVEETYLLPMAQRRAAASAGKGAPLLEAEAVAVDINPYAGGTWISEGANQFWQLRLKSVGASSLSLYFKPVRLPPGSELSLASPDGSTSHGPYTATDLQGRKEFWTPSVPGDTAVVRLKLPANPSGLQLNLAQARIGYRSE